MAALAAVVILMGLSACGDKPAELGEAQVLIETDSGPTGLASLRQGDEASGTQNERVPITRDGIATPIYAVRLNDLKAGVRVGALATVTLTKCAITDYIPNARSFTACEGTREYDYDPVKIRSRFRLVGGAGRPNLSGDGTTVGDSLTSTCSTALHHCTLSQEAKLELSGEGVPSGGAGWLVYEVRASSPKAASCASEDPTKCHVLAVETQKGTAMYGVRVEGEPPATKTLPADTGSAPDSPRLGVLVDRGDKDEARDVVFSMELAPAGDLKQLEGDQMVVGSKLTIEEDLPQAPDIANYLVLSDRPTGIRGRYLLSDSYVKTGNNGENCDKSCEFVRNAVVTTILRCDVEAGRRYVNLVADASRADAKRGETVTVTGGYLRVSEYFDSAISKDRESVRNCNR